MRVDIYTYIYVYIEDGDLVRCSHPQINTAESSIYYNQSKLYVCRV